MPRPVNAGVRAPEGCSMKAASRALCRNQRRSNSAMHPTGWSLPLIENLNGYADASRRVIAALCRFAVERFAKLQPLNSSKGETP